MRTQHSQFEDILRTPCAVWKDFYHFVFSSRALEFLSGNIDRVQFWCVQGVDSVSGQTPGEVCGTKDFVQVVSEKGHWLHCRRKASRSSLTLVNLKTQTGGGERGQRTLSCISLRGRVDWDRKMETMMDSASARQIVDGIF